MIGLPFKALAIRAIRFDLHATHRVALALGVGVRVM